MPLIALIAPKSAGIVILHSRGGVRRCLLLRAYRDWDFPKGEIDTGEEALDAAIREAAEEASVTALAFDWGTVWRDTAPYSRGKVARYFIARTDDANVKLGISPSLGRPEHHEYRWIPLSEAKSLAAARLHPIIDWVSATVGQPTPT